MRNMSFFHTQEQIRAGTKTETTRKGWGFLKVGDMVMACVKCQGLGKGGKVERIRSIRILKVERIYITLKYYSRINVINEGYPELDPYDFIKKILIKKCGFKYGYSVNRIIFEYIKDADDQ